MGIATAALELATGILTFINTERGRALITDVRDVKLQILAEENKGYDSNDPLLETLYAKAKILVDAATAELALHVAK